MAYTQRQYILDKLYIAAVRKEMQRHLPLDASRIDHWCPAAIREAFPFLFTWPVEVPLHLLQKVFITHQQINTWEADQI